MKTETGSNNGCTVTVVVAEDNRPIRELLRNYIKILPGAKLLGAAADGCKALEIVAAKHPQLLLMDLNMPGINGLQALALIREYHPATRVFIVSADDSDAVKATCLAQGADRFISKFALHNELNEAIAEVFPGTALRARRNGELPDGPPRKRAATGRRINGERLPAQAPRTASVAMPPLEPPGDPER